ncbi:hypothetical protein BDZ97DRAFT_1777013 [Flammula alnicola]|nr:hypothetical protein BDZ97DRAFT_1777013 [Flammula alnicola]
MLITPVSWVLILWSELRTNINWCRLDEWIIPRCNGLQLRIILSRLHHRHNLIPTFPRFTDGVRGCILRNIL